MNESTRPLVSVLTPTWNRAEYLPDVWKGLNSQTIRSFEWIIGNDGSDDGTIEMVQELASKSDFSVTLINASIRVGKSRMDNEAVQLANGEFIIWCDSDDVLLPKAIETLLATWESVAPSDREHFAGVAALCESEGEILGNDYPKAELSDLQLSTLLYRMKSDLVIFTRSELLKKNPFKEVDFLISESSVWHQIGGRLTRFIPRVLERKRYGEKNCLSLSGKMRYNRGHAHAIALTNRFTRDNITAREGFWRIVNFGRYRIHGDLSLFHAAKLWRENSGSALVLIALLPFSLLMSIKDRLQNKVEKTHLEFDKAIEIVEFSREVLN
jgi:glycosyltransferase involved in cell wall biosynthesis